MTASPATGPLAISFDDVKAARERINGVAHVTPVLTSRTADAMAGASLFFKAENLQRVGAFKFRGAYNAISRLSPEQKKRGVIAFSSGNHAQGIALAAQLLGAPATIVMPHDAPAVKLAATRGYGAEVVIYERGKEDRDAIGKRLAAERGLELIPPFNHVDIMAGQGTAVLEMFEQMEEMGGVPDVLFVPLGGGGLLSGAATVAKALNPACRVIGVEPEAGNDGQRSLAEGKLVEIAVPRTLADGAQTQCLGTLTFPVLQALVEKVVTVSDAQLVEAMKFMASRMKVLVEPTGCLGIAAAFAAGEDIAGKRVGIVISGGNVDLASFAELCLKGAA
ncbi:threo-3-hydroxy-L-aspartate ammonia-lyase [Radicibacter daui]|uniref:threo-3-hydroxy-L-aspartate ammonia-lyase n=1 Tax=Radicibacter daui TaxID=3064829 RepID=UPI004046BAB2